MGGNNKDILRRHKQYITPDISQIREFVRQAYMIREVKSDITVSEIYMQMEHMSNFIDALVRMIVSQQQISDKVKKND